MNKISQRNLTSGAFLIGSMVVSNFVNFLYNAYLGRALGFADFALITLANSLWYLFTLLFSAFSITVNSRVAFLSARTGRSEGIHFYRFLRRSVLPVVLVAMGIWVVAAPFTASFFRLADPLLVFSITPILAAGLYLALYKGVLSGRFLFHFVAIIHLVESCSKLLIALLLVKLGLSHLAYLSISVSVIIGLIAAHLFVRTSYPKHVKPAKHAFHFPKTFFLASLMTGLSSTAFLTLDLILTKHYFHPTVANSYALLSLAGKMIFFFGSLFTVFTIPVTSHDEGAHRDPNRAFYYIFMLSMILTLAATVAIGPLGNLFLPTLLGNKIFAVTPYLTSYALAIGLYTLSDAIVIFHLIRKQYLFPAIALLFTIIMSVGITLFHGGIKEVVNVILFTSIANFAVLVPLHFLQRNGGFMVRNMVDFVYLFTAMKSDRIKKGGKRILIYNWRDTRHNFAGGAEVYIHELAKRWVADGNSVTVFCGNDGNCPRHEYIDGVHVIRRGGFYMVYFWAFVYYVLRFHNRFDVIIDSENGIPFFTPFYARQQIFLLMHHVHQDVFRKNLLPPWSWIASFMEGKLMPFVYRNVQIITVSPSSKNDILKYRLATIEPLIVYNGIDLDAYKPGRKASKPLVIYVGRLKYYKRINLFLKAAKKIAETVPEAKFVVAGGGEELHDLIAYAKRIGVDDRVTFTGKISEEEKIDLYQKAWVFVNPSSMEGWGITGIEANACGAPIVAADVPGLRDSVKDGYNGYLVKTEDEQGFADAIHAIITGSKRRAVLSKNALEWASHFCWEKSAERGYKIISGKFRKANRPLLIGAQARVPQ